jgi:DNA-binding transcriptional regulator YdaS (Cro superfamily)
MAADCPDQLPRSKTLSGIDELLLFGNDARPMHPLLEFLNALSPEDRDGFASRCGTTVGYLRKAVSTRQQLREALCINIERESLGRVRCEQLRPTGVDWAFLRGTRPWNASTHPISAPLKNRRAHAGEGGRDRPSEMPGARRCENPNERPDLGRPTRATRAERP